MMRESTRKQKQVSVSTDNIEDFRAAYEDCDNEVFMFHGVPVLKDYAKYLIEYFDSLTTNKADAE